MIVSTTEIGTFKRCRRMWYYSSNNGKMLKPIIKSPALNLGTLVHNTFDAWCQDPTADPQVLFDSVASEKLGAMSKTYRERTGTDMSEAELDSLIDVAILTKAMLGNYRDQYGGPIPRGFTLVSAEKTFQVALQGDLLFQGTLDALIEKEGVPYVLERKTYSYRPKKENLAMNNQFLAYIVLAQANAVPVNGVIYDGMWKRPKGKPEDLFCRELITRSEEEVDEFIRETVAVVREMNSLPEIYTNRRWEGCYDCDYERLCRAESRGEDTDYVMKYFFEERKV